MGIGFKKEGEVYMISEKRYTAKTMLHIGKSGVDALKTFANPETGTLNLVVDTHCGEDDAVEITFVFNKTDAERIIKMGAEERANDADVQ